MNKIPDDVTENSLKCHEKQFEKPSKRIKMSLFQQGGRGSQKTTLSLIKDVTFSLGRVEVKGNSDNVTEYDIVYLRRENFSCGAGGVWYW